MHFLNSIHRHHDNFHDEPMKHILNRKFIRHNIIGYTTKYVLIYVVLYYIILCAQYYGSPTKYPIGKNDTDDESEKVVLVYRENFCKSVKNWHKESEVMNHLLAYFLGLYAATIMYRWWSQIIHMPRICDLAIVLNGIVIPG